MTQTQEHKKSVNRNRKTQILDLPNKDFKSTVFKMQISVWFLFVIS